MAAARCSLTEIAGPTRRIVESIVWCTVSTVDPTGRPRSRVMHPVWFWDRTIPSGLVAARPTPLRVRHLEATPAVSCCYWDPSHDTVAIDAVASWLDADDRTAAWDAIAAVPPPVGFDPAAIWEDGPTAADCGILRLDPFRIVTTPVGGPAMIWSRSPT